MASLPEDIGLRLLRGLGAYIRATQAIELPLSVRRFRGFRTAGLPPHKATILALLDSEAQRALVLQWLDEDKPALGKDDADILRIACVRDEGWEQALGERSKAPAPAASETKATQGVDKERVKTRKARDEVRKLRAELDEKKGRHTAERAALEQTLDELRGALAAATERADATTAALELAQSASDRELRRARSATKEAAKQVRELKAALKEKRGAPPAEAKREAPRPTKRKKPKARSGPRVALRVPRGRREDDPATLDSWLDRDDVHLLIDGYNVTKAGYPDLTLEAQRDRLLTQANTLAARKKVLGTVVFDGSETPVLRPKVAKGTLRAVFSSAGEIADDRIVKILEELPPTPVVVVTNDKELRQRSGAVGATVASSEQLLALLR